MFDEAEREDANAAARMQGVLDLVRQSSSESGAEIIKGSQTHAAKRFRIRSAFFFSSINVGIEHRADESRVTVLALRSADATNPEAEAARFDALAETVNNTITPDFAAGLLARTVSLLPTIRHNAEIFARAAAGKFCNRRLGDQLGALLAGAYSLHSSREITAEEAMAFLDKQAWEETVAGDVEMDEIRLLSHITQKRFRVSTGNGSGFDATIGRLIEAAMGKEPQIPADIADTELRQIGIRVGQPQAKDGKVSTATSNYGVYISNTHPTLKGMLAGTPWGAGWSRSVARLPGARVQANPVRFGPGHLARAVWVPIATIDGS